MTSMLQSVMDHGTGYPARARGFTLPGRRQDRHHGRLHGRLVRRLHAESRVRRVGGLRREEDHRAGHDRRARRAAGVDRLHDRRDPRPAGRGLPGAGRAPSTARCAPRPACSRPTRARTSRPRCSTRARSPPSTARTHPGRAAPQPVAPALRATGRRAELRPAASSTDRPRARKTEREDPRALRPRRSFATAADPIAGADAAAAGLSDALEDQPRSLDQRVRRS